jgi:methionyl-tRNA formyltransferase
MTTITPLKLIFAGAGEFGLPTLRALAEGGYEIVQVVSQPDRPAGRGRKLTPTAIAQFAIERSLPLLRTANINDEKLPPADVMVVIAFGQKIADHIVHHPRLGSVNLHASRLPRFRGAAPIHAAILAGEKTTGNSIIRLTQKMDAGDVLAMSELPIGELETTGELHDRLAAGGVPLMLKVLDDLANGQATETPQDHSHATLARKLSRDSAKIDWTHTAEEIARQIRAMHPWPACHVRIIDSDTNRELARATLVRARPTAAKGESRVGHIEWSGAITAGTGAVEVVELQPEGGRVMSLVDFRNGHPWKPGMRIESA